MKTEKFLFTCLIVFDVITMTVYAIGDSQKYKQMEKSMCNCKEKSKSLRCPRNENVTRFDLGDLCRICQQTACGRLATTLVIPFKGNGETCSLGKKLTDCCPAIKEIIMDDQTLCPCLCETGLTVRGSGKSGFVQCDGCKPLPKTSLMLSSAKSHRQEESETTIEKNSVQIVPLQISVSLLSVSVSAIIIAAIAFYCYRQRHKNITNLRNNLEYNQPNAGASNFGRGNEYRDQPIPVISHQSEGFRPHVQSPFSAASVCSSDILFDRQAAQAADARLISPAASVAGDSNAPLLLNYNRNFQQPLGPSEVV